MFVFSLVVSSLPPVAWRTALLVVAMFNVTDRLFARVPAAVEAATATFTNPIAPGADPWVIRHGDDYYWCSSEADLGVAIHRSRRLTERGEKVVVWRAPALGPHSAQIWAPELHRLDGRWYIYVAASDGRNENHRMIVLESNTDDPMDGFTFKSELYTGDEPETGRHNRWAIDGTVLEHGGRRYFLWSGWQDERDIQWLYIAPMANPWTLAGTRVRLCANDSYAWERVDENTGRGLNEAPQILQRNGRVWVVYSASASWEITYKLGMLELAAGGDPLNPADWLKFPQPVFQRSDEVWGVGHNCFVTSPDGTEDWLVYHAKLERKPGWNRAIYLQRFEWDAAGRPVFGTPVGSAMPQAVPSGEPVPRAEPTVRVEPAPLGRAVIAALVEPPLVKSVRVVNVTEPRTKTASLRPPPQRPRH